eukprot:gene19997-59262_t
MPTTMPTAIRRACGAAAAHAKAKMELMKSATRRMWPTDYGVSKAPKRAVTEKKKGAAKP